MGYIYHLKQDEEIVYVGQSISLASMYGRMRSHTSDKEFNGSSYREVHDQDINRLESLDIVNHLPRYNKDFGPSSDYGINVNLFLKMCGDRIKKIAFDSDFIVTLNDRSRLFLSDDDVISIQFDISGSDVSEYTKKGKTETVEFKT